MEKVLTHDSSSTSNEQAAADPQPVPALTPEQIVDQVRGIRAGMGDITPLTAAQRQKLRRTAAVSNDVLQAQINIINDHVELIIGQPSAEVRQMVDSANRWTAVADELRSLLEGIEGANLIRRHELATIGAQASSVGSSLARLPQYSTIVPQVKEIRRLKRIGRRKKSSPATPGSQAAAAIDARTPATM